MNYYLPLIGLLLLSACNILPPPPKDSIASNSFNTPPSNTILKPSAFETFSDNVSLRFEPFYQYDDLVHYFDANSFTPLFENGKLGYVAIILVDGKTRNKANDGDTHNKTNGTIEQSIVGAMTMKQKTYCSTGEVTIFYQKTWTNKNIDSATLIQHETETQRTTLSTNSPAWILCRRASDMIHTSIFKK